MDIFEIAQLFFTLMIQIDKVTSEHESLGDNYQPLRIAQAAFPWGFSTLKRLQWNRISYQ